MSITAADPVQVGILVRYVEPRSGRTRVGRVTRTISRGINKGYVEVRPSSTVDSRASIVDPNKVRQIA